MSKIQIDKPRVINEYNRILKDAYSTIQPVDEKVKKHLINALEFSKSFKNRKQSKFHNQYERITACDLHSRIENISSFKIKRTSKIHSIAICNTISKQCNSLNFTIVNEIEIKTIGIKKSFIDLPKGIRIVAKTR